MSPAETVNFLVSSKMDDITRYRPNEIEAAEYERDQEETKGPSMMDLIKGIIRRWPIILLVFLLLVVPGVPAIFFMFQPTWETEGLIRVSPVQSAIVFEDKPGSAMGNYYSFMQTEAAVIKSNPVMNAAADKLQGKNLEFFSKDRAIVSTLKGAIGSGKIKVIVPNKMELIRISMQHQNPREAETIVNAILKAYVERERRRSESGSEERLGLLIQEENRLENKLTTQRNVLRQLAEEYGTTVLTDRQNLKFEYVADLERMLNDLQTRQLALEAKLELLQDPNREGVSPERQLNMRKEHIETNPVVNLLTQNIAQAQQQYIIMQQTMKSENPRLQEQEKLIENLKIALEERRKEAAEEFDSKINKEMAIISRYEIATLKAELENNIEHQKRVREKLDKEEKVTRDIGRHQLAIQDQQERIQQTKSLLGEVRHEITKLEVEKHRPARVTIQNEASSTPVPGRRIKAAAALFMGAFGAGVAMAFLLTRMDMKVRTPSDLVRRTGLPIIGTTVCTDTENIAMLPGLVAEDYRTIQANIGLMTGNGVPQRLIVTSAGKREGKTTFSINLSTSLAQSGKRVLLIDGDLRKPDIAKSMNIENPKPAINEILNGADPHDLLTKDCIPGMDILGASHSDYDPAMACDIVAKFVSGQFLERIADGYDNIIIDTPPVLVGPDALLWSKAAKSVIMVSFSGQSLQTEIHDAVDRLRKVGADVLGTVLHSVDKDYSYYRYGYGYGKEGKKTKKRRPDPKLLLTGIKIDPNKNDDDA